MVNETSGEMIGESTVGLPTCSRTLRVAIPKVHQAICFLILLCPPLLHAQSSDKSDVPQDAVHSQAIPFCTEAASPDEDVGEETAPARTDCQAGDSLSEYDRLISELNSGKSVEAEIVVNDTVKPAVFSYDVLHNSLHGFYEKKKKLHDAIGLAWSVDYSILVQHASFTESGEDTASSSVFRVYGTWLRFGDRGGTMGNLVWKIETRNPIFENPTPRDMGFDTGSALSTANYKVLDYWGVTDLYWKQRFKGGRYAFLVGHMDPGDWADQYPLLNAWTSFTNDAFYNNPTEAIPKRGFGIVGQIFHERDFYAMGGIHDANGKDGKLDFDSFWSTREWFTWAELGYRSKRSVSARHNVHVHYWHQDARVDAGVAESDGFTFTYSTVRENDVIAFLRAGYSSGDAAQMRRFVGVGMSYKPFQRDRFGVATSWGSPPDKSKRDQITSEAFYRLQLTQNISLTPSLQVTYKPSLTLETNWVLVPGLRMRLVF